MSSKPFENLTLKSIAFGLTLLIWFLVVGGKKSEVRLNVPVELRNLPEQLEITQQSASHVEMTIRGFASIVKQLTPGDINVHLDLTNVVEGTTSFALAPEEMLAPVGSTVIQVSPAHIEIALETTVAKKVPVNPIVRGSPIEGYQVGKVTADPNILEIVGARSVLYAIAKIETEPVAVEQATRNFAKKTKFKLPAGVRLEQKAEENNELKAKIVSVNVEITPKIVELFFEDIPLHVQNEARAYTLSPPTVTALVAGPELQLSSMRPGDLSAFIETRQLPEGQTVVQPVFKLPESISVKRYYPKTITVTITKKDN